MTREEAIKAIKALPVMRYAENSQKTSDLTDALSLAISAAVCAHVPKAAFMRKCHIVRDAERSWTEVRKLLATFTTTQICWMQNDLVNDVKLCYNNKEGGDKPALVKMCWKKSIYSAFSFGLY